MLENIQVSKPKWLCRTRGDAEGPAVGLGAAGELGPLVRVRNLLREGRGPGGPRVRMRVHRRRVPHALDNPNFLFLPELRRDFATTAGVSAVAEYVNFVDRDHTEKTLKNRLCLYAF